MVREIVIYEMAVKQIIIVPFFSLLFSHARNRACKNWQQPDEWVIDRELERSRDDERKKERKKREKRKERKTGGGSDGSARGKK